MKLFLSKDSYLHSKDYFELLTSLDVKPILNKAKLKPFLKTKDGVIVNPNFTSEMYEKLNYNKVFIKCCCVRFLNKGIVMIVNGETHTNSLKNCKDILNINVTEYERGFLLSNMTFISCEEAPSFIKSYKLNKDFVLKKELYTCYIEKETVSFLKNDNEMIKGNIIKQKDNKNKTIILFNVNFYLYDNICKNLILSINYNKNTVILYELKKTFVFSKRKHAAFIIDKIINSI